MLHHHLQLDLYNKASRYGDTVRVHNHSSCILPKTMSIVRPYLYLLPKEQSRNWTLEHWNTLVQSQNWGSYLEVWQLGKSQPCSSIQFFALSALMLTNGGVVDDTDARYRSLSIKLSKIPYTGLTPHPAVLSRPHLPIGHRAPSYILLFFIDFRY